MKQGDGTVPLFHILEVRVIIYLFFKYDIPERIIR